MYFVPPTVASITDSVVNQWGTLAENCNKDITILIGTLEEFFDKHTFNQMLEQSLEFLPQHLLKHLHKCFVRQPLKDLTNNCKSQLSSINRSSSFPLQVQFSPPTDQPRNSSAKIVSAN